MLQLNSDNSNDAIDLPKNENGLSIDIGLTFPVKGVNDSTQDFEISPGKNVPSYSTENVESLLLFSEVVRVAAGVS